MAPQVTDYTKLTKFEQYYAFAAVSSLFFIWGLSYGLLDVLNSHFYQIFELTKTMTTMLQFAYFISYLIVAPPMGIFMRRYGYKLGIHIGLGLFSTGAILYWPAAHYHLYPAFVCFTFVTASGLATLEVAASSYLTVLGPAKTSAMRLTLAQSTNGIATVIGPLIAAYTFFNGENANDLGTVQYVYLAMSLFGVVVNIAIYFSKLPEIQQAMTAEQIEAAGYEKPTIKGLFKFKRTVFGALAEFAYVGSQVGLASFTIFYITEQPGISPAYPKSDASNMFSGCQAVFTIARFLGVWYLRYIDPSFALFANGLMLMLFSVLTAVINGKGGIACLFLTFFFEGVCYPVIFAVATEYLGQYNKLGSGLIAAAVCGGAVWPAMTGAVADAFSTQRAMLIIFIGYVPLAAYGGGMWITNSNSRYGKLTIWQPRHDVNPAGAIEPSSPDLVVDGEKREEERVEVERKDLA